MTILQNNNMYMCIVMTYILYGIQPTRTVTCRRVLFAVSSCYTSPVLLIIRRVIHYSFTFTHQ